MSSSEDDGWTEVVPKRALRPQKPELMEERIKKGEVSFISNTFWNDSHAIPL